VEVESSPTGFHDWAFHVAPIVSVRNADGSSSPVVLDPSLFDHPVPISTWSRRLEDRRNCSLDTIVTAPWVCFYNPITGEGVPDDDYSATTSKLNDHAHARDLRMFINLLGR
jgi:hypothetical protein